ncbi:MAG: hypothetical protein KQH63_11450 [Desulfobulbaceae bacterium]|nr:hypothetical protein [Desulfobulbaceae bacterium]
MQSYYLELVRFVFQHEYYASLQGAFTFQPQKETQRLLSRYGLLFRSTRNGFAILYQAVRDETETLVPLRKLPEQFGLRFWICSVSPFLGVVSALPLFRSTNQVLYFDNLHDRRDGDTLYLNAGAPAATAADENDLKTLAPPTWRYSKEETKTVFVRVQSADGTVIRSEYCRPYQGNVECRIDMSEVDPGLVSITAGEDTEIFYCCASPTEGSPLAAVDLYAGSSVPETYAFIDAGGIPQPKIFTCRIARRSSLWRYVVVPKFNTSLQAGQLSIEDGDDRYTFGNATAVQTMSGEAAFAIESEDVIPHQQEPIKGLALKRNHTDLIKELPNPGPDQVMAGSGNFYSEIYVYV